jgi:dipeptidyl aminopeptidase/acylaminoacyl peptidase
VRHLPLIAVALMLTGLAPHLARAGRPLMPEDWYRFQDVSQLTIAPDGTAVAWLVTSYDEASDETRGAVWMADWAGRQRTRITHGESVSKPRFSPDGRHLSFLSAGPDGGTPQLFWVDRRGGKPQQLSHVSGEITGYDWSPDGRHAVLVVRAGEGHGAPKPLVIDAYHFKEDGDGYLTADTRGHLCLLDVTSGACLALASDPARADSHAVFSADGHQIAFIGNPSAERAAGRDEIYVVDAAAGATPRLLLSAWSPNVAWLGWSPDGRLLGFLEGDELRYNAYIDDQLAVADVGTGRVRRLTHQLDRGIYSPRFAGDAIEFAVEDDGYQYPASVSLATGQISRLAGAVVVHEIAAAAGHTAVIASSDRAPREVSALEAGQLRPLSAHNPALFAEISLGAVEDISFPSRDGTVIHGQIVKPPDYVPGRRYPTIVWIHGGPQGQDDHSLELRGYGPPLDRQLFATHGYVVLAVNYRGGTGRGAAFARAIVADWGHKEVEDLEAAIDWAIAQGIADPNRLGVGGWSYGALLTDYLIASDTRLRAAISGAGSGNQISMYGADEYTIEYDAEMGPPWRETARWLKVSYPFFHADRIHTPTLFLGGDKDFDVPIAGGEQMYQALRTLGVPAQLIVYPGETHTLDRPSFLVDRYRRYLEWMAKYLHETAAATADRPARSAAVQ